VLKCWSDEVSVNAIPKLLLIRNGVEPALKQSRSGFIPMRSRSDPDETPFGQARQRLVREGNIVITMIGVPARTQAHQYHNTPALYFYHREH